MKQTGQSALRVLVIEDETILAMELEDILEDLGHRVVGVAATVPQATQMIETMAHRIDAVVLDANLAGQFASPIADALAARNIPYIVASGYGPDDLRASGFDAPILSKPYHAHEIRDALLALRRSDAG